MNKMLAHTTATGTTTKTRVTSLRALKVGDSFRVRSSVSYKFHTVTAVARCGRGYVRVETSSPGAEVGQKNYIVNMHGTTEVEVES